MRLGVWADPYTRNPCLTTRQLAAWQKTRRVQLPDEYRFFLLEIGDGGRMRCRLPGAYSDFVVRSLGEFEVSQRLTAEFPVGRRRLRERMAQLKAEGWAGVEALFPELDQIGRASCRGRVE